MLAGATKGLYRRSLVGLSLTSPPGAKALQVKEKTMRVRSLLFSCAILALISIYNSADAWAQQGNGKNCRMEQQCHWENFKKICTWVKVCR
jgi:hypothetical protein